MAEKRIKKTAKAKKAVKKPGTAMGKKKSPVKKFTAGKTSSGKTAPAKKPAKTGAAKKTKVGAKAKSKAGAKTKDMPVAASARSDVAGMKGKSSGRAETDIDIERTAGLMGPDGSGELERTAVEDGPPAIDFEALFADDDALDADSDGSQLEDFILFRLDNEGFALRVSEVNEILRHQRITWVPRCAAHVIGMTSRRGAMMPVVDLHVLIDGRKSGPVEKGRILVLSDSGTLVGVLVNKDIGIKGFSNGCVLDPPSHIGGRGSALVEGVLLVDDEFFTVLRPEAITRTKASGRLDEREA